MRFLSIALVASSALAFTTATRAESVQGIYLEARSTSGPLLDCAAQPGDVPRQAVFAWQVREGTHQGVKLDGQSIVAVVTADPANDGSLGSTHTVFVVDERTTAAAEAALVHLAKQLAPAVIQQSGNVVRSKLDVRIAEGCGCGAAVVDCSLAKVRTRRLTDADQVLVGGATQKNPLGEVFSSNQAFVTQYACSAEPAVIASNLVIAFTGSFSR